ncbi:hypothetical protein DUNSADRAFT_14778 [Dunaliella salina]|uniref:GST N-terminal domain-containing protein n=1 Tax=Dunaliella salina TaxID=3046 RepID=A0ABQ7G6R6_DUNSA|nr:hypothetical protein DUNSADRAFT_14778 [Dunaliella salina]|eukprot:KAF5830304.1 hypothetical protein DUNSADRAFT_14778 [Dunaliella salina]
MLHALSASSQRVILPKSGCTSAAVRPHNILPKATRSVIVRAQETNTEAITTPSQPTYKNVGPEAKPFGVGEGELGNVVTASLPTLMRLGAGAFCVGYEAQLVEDDGGYAVFRANNQKVKETSKVATYPRPAKPLEIYEYELSPYCKKVREAITMLDLDAIFYPTPRDGDVWRPKAIEMGGKKQFPYMVDPNTGKSMYESDDIVKYLFNTYGPGEQEIPGLLTAGFFTVLSAGLGNVARVGSNTIIKSKQPAQPLVLWGYEASPFVKIVRETLCDMQLPYKLVTVARGSPKREELIKKYGAFAAPCLEDPNTESYLFESSAIVKYLKDTYSADATSPIPSAA